MIWIIHVDSIHGMTSSPGATSLAEEFEVHGELQDAL